jgi:hypothetical protein
MKEGEEKEKNKKKRKKIAMWKEGFPRVGPALLAVQWFIADRCV